MAWSRHKRARIGGFVVCAGLGGLLFAGVALGAWSKSVAGGPQTISTASLDAPKSLTASCRKRGNAYTVTLTWKSSTSPAVSGYDVDRSPNGSSYSQIAQVAGAGSTTYSDTAVTVGTYYYELFAYNASSSWTSAASNIATVTC